MIGCLIRLMTRVIFLVRQVRMYVVNKERGGRRQGAMAELKENEAASTGVRRGDLGDHLPPAGLQGQVPRELFSAPGQPLEYTSFSHIYGFHDECKRRSNTKLWKTCVDCLPIAAIIDDKIFCCHRELSSDLQSTVQSRRISRPTDVPGATLWCDLAFVHGWAENYRDVPVLDYFSAIITL
ncbi:hypothetical protein HPB48_022544 [Haemaphysalis longicornis]|uniref:protein-serine/threonine phosphatase n=1 Tax=Haemaphysalis longicornis TaxID=44386 RepID=A0A9J6FTI3_HAELO|nr:hypothetical protein HPB48_022544 [Haemaphysalis longicornis]